MTGQRWVGFAALLCGGTLASAQSIVVQQPVVDVFSLSTVVTVPDRGSTFLGGISSARDQRIRAGFLPFGSSLGMERTHSGAWASVYVHDLEAMDKALLAAGSSAPPPPQHPLAAQAYRTLWQQHTGRLPAVSATAPRAAWSPSSVVPLTAGSLPPTDLLQSPSIAEPRPAVPPPPARSGSPAVGAASAPPDGVRRWSARLEGSPGTTPAAARERFGTPAPGHSTSVPSDAPAAASRSMNAITHPMAP